MKEIKKITGLNLFLFCQFPKIGTSKCRIKLDLILYTELYNIFMAQKFWKRNYKYAR